MIVRVRSWMPRLCFCDFERQTNSLRQRHLWRKGHFSGFGKSMCYEVLPFVFDDKLERHDRTTGYWSSTKTKQERIHVECRSFTTMHIHRATLSRYVCLLLYVIVAPPILRLHKNSNSRVVQILIKRKRKQ